MHYYKSLKLCKFPWMLNFIDISDKNNKLLGEKKMPSNSLGLWHFPLNTFSISLVSFLIAQHLLASSRKWLITHAHLANNMQHVTSVLNNGICSLLNTNADTYLDSVGNQQANEGMFFTEMLNQN